MLLIVFHKAGANVTELRLGNKINEESFREKNSLNELLLVKNAGSRKGRRVEDAKEPQRIR